MVILIMLQNICKYICTYIYNIYMYIHIHKFTTQGDHGNTHNAASYAQSMAPPPPPGGGMMFPPAPPPFPPSNMVCIFMNLYICIFIDKYIFVFKLYLCLNYVWLYKYLYLHFLCMYFILIYFINMLIFIYI
jgi:hypothetical protein